MEKAQEYLIAFGVGVAATITGVLLAPMVKKAIEKYVPMGD